MNLAKRAYLKKEVIEGLGDKPLLIGVNGSTAQLSKKDEQYFVHTSNGKGLMFSGTEEVLDYLVLAYTA